jgi:hypothetical protein
MPTLKFTKILVACGDQCNGKYRDLLNELKPKKSVPCSYKILQRANADHQV